MQYYRFRVTLGWLTHLFKSSTRQDHNDLRPILERFLPLNGIAVDVGAHGGQISRLMAKIANLGTVYAVEPSSYTRSILRASLFLRRARNIHVLAAALGAGPGCAIISTPLKRGKDMGYGLANLSGASGASVVSELVPVLSLDEVVETLKIGRLDFIKVDIEGFEHEFIKGAANTIKKFKPTFLMEMDDNLLRRSGSSVNSLWGEMVKLGYAPHTPNLLPLGESPPGKISTDIVWMPR